MTLCWRSIGTTVLVGVAGCTLAGCGAGSSAQSSHTSSTSALSTATITDAPPIASPTAPVATPTPLRTPRVFPNGVTFVLNVASNHSADEFVVRTDLNVSPDTLGFCGEQEKWCVAGQYFVELAGLTPGTHFHYWFERMEGGSHAVTSFKTGEITVQPQGVEVFADYP